MADWFTSQQRSHERSTHCEHLAEFELRVGDLRAMYAVDSANQEVIIGVVGEKRGNQLFVEGREYHDHKSDESE